MNNGLRYNTGKIKWSLVSWKALVPMVNVLEFGAKKYAPFNWTNGLKYTEICESLLRHTYSFLEGENIDKESKLPHVGHILCNAMFLSFMFLFKKEFDDRYAINNLDNNTININVLEIASNLAHTRTLYESGDICNNEDDMYKKENNNNSDSECLNYTDEIQERFNMWYDYYLNKINKNE